MIYIYKLDEHFYLHHILLKKENENVRIFKFGYLKIKTIIHK